MDQSKNQLQISTQLAKTQLVANTVPIVLSLAQLSPSLFSHSCLKSIINSNLGHTLACCFANCNITLHQLQIPLYLGAGVALYQLDPLWRIKNDII